jgi:DNA-binding HxlR family transcriptional regulator
VEAILKAPINSVRPEKRREEQAETKMAAVRNLDALDDVIHQKVRLGVMSCLMASDGVDFNFLKAALGVSDGNLSTHLSVLEEHGYIAVHKEFIGKKPRTTYATTPEGREAFEAYIAALEALVKTE